LAAPTALEAARPMSPPKALGSRMGRPRIYGCQPGLDASSKENRAARQER